MEKSRGKGRSRNISSALALYSLQILTADIESEFFFSLERKAMTYLEIVNYSSVKLKKGLFM